MSDRKVNGVVVPEETTYAFPMHAVIPSPEGGAVAVTTWGMTLRDWFAGQVIMGMLARGPVPGGNPDVFADSAYLVAEALMRARAGK